MLTSVVRTHRASPLPHRLGKRAALLVLAALLSHLSFIALSSATAQDPDRYKAATELFHKQDFAGAAAIFQQVEQVSPGRTDASLYLAKCQVNLGQFNEGDTVLTGYLASHPANGEAAFLHAYLLFRENKAALSLAAYTHAATLATPRGGDLKIVALDYVLLEDNASAVHWLQRATELEPGDPEAWYFLGRSLFHQSLFPEARQAFEHTLRLTPDSVRARNNLGLTFEAENHLDDAAKEYRAAIAQDQLQRKSSSKLSSDAGNPPTETPSILPRHPPETASETRAQPYLNLGSLLIRQSHSAAAVEALTEATEIASDCVACHQELGRAFAHLGRTRDARTQLEIAVKLRPQDAGLHYELGLLCQKDGDAAAAKAELMRSKELYGTRATDPTIR